MKMHHHHRRRKKRPNYGTRTVEVSRGFNGFGFTISGQQPCILSCIVANSPADQAGLRAGDFLISVNGLNVSKLPHEAVVQLIGNSLGTIRMQIAENYFSDSSDEENIVSHINRVKPRYLHHKLKMNRVRNSPQKNARNGQVIAAGLIDQGVSLRPVIEDAPPPVAHNIIHSPNASTSKDISNVSAMVRKTDPALDSAANGSAALEYRAIVGYLGTIEMPKQIATSSKLQTVRSCIRKMRQEKRNPTTVLMTILPNCLTLRNSSASILATYPSSRLNYVSSSSESENRFFGLVTSAIYANIDDDSLPVDNDGLMQQATREVIISNSCHVFVVDMKICEHSLHEQRAAEFKISCTKDPISNLCLEFPNNSEYVVNLIRSMYTMKVLPPSVRNLSSPNSRHHDAYNGRHQDNLQANSPQPSNHSEVTTTSSNSDSGIGFHNDCTNISDRILVVDFPGLVVNRSGNIVTARPHAICNTIEPAACENVLEKPLIPLQAKAKSVDFNTRLTVRAMPDPKVTVSPQKSEVPDLLASFGVKGNSTPLTATRSCDDVISSVERDGFLPKDKKQLQMSMDDITMLSGSSNNQAVQDHVFVEPRKPFKAAKRLTNTYKDEEDGFGCLQDESKLVSYKLSPKVFGLSKPNSSSYQDLSQKGANIEGESSVDPLEIWGSLQDLHKSGSLEQPTGHFLEGTYSEPDLVSRALPTSASPFRRWGQSSFRTPKTTESQRAQLARRPSSLAASENDVYTKSMDDFNLDVDSQLSQSGDLARETSSAQNHSPEPSGAVAWGASFEKLLEDTAGIHTFAEFLKKEFSAENIYFWTACERYRRTESTADRAAQAMDIFSKHLASGAPEPVNVDSQARNTAEDNLQTADRNLFNQAQKQIFNLMKFDSYQRFIRSDLYKKCVEAESKNQTLPYPGDKLDELLRTTPESPGPSKLKKSASNAEDRHRKSLLPWHRKTRCKSRDRAETDINSNKSSKFQSGNSLKPPMTNSASDIHSSRSSLSSFDANVVAALGSGPDDGKTVYLCRVILCDGATTVVQIRPNETVRQLVERLLEKRGIHYQFFDVIFSGNSKAIDLESPSNLLSGKEVQIEQRVAFKLDLPDPKVISVKSKPKKALSDVLKPILHKYNYRLEQVQIFHRETHEQLDMTLPVTVADGQRLQVVMLKNDGCRTDPLQHHKLRTAHNHCYQNQSCVQLPKNPPFPSKVIKTGAQQSTLDEITNKVFNELLQGKVESHANQMMPTKPSDQCSVRSEDCASETSSVFDRLRRKDSNIPALKALRPKKLDLPSKCSVAPSEDGVSLSTQTTSASDPTSNGIKKPLIAKWKTGVKLQVTGRAENQEEFLEGLKRAQRARLEDQRGTEINSELPDFLKDKENLSVASKLRKVRANLSPVGGGAQIIEDGGVSAARSIFETTGNHITDRPQPAPRLSIGKTNSSTNVSPMKVDMNGSEIFPSSNETEFDPTSKGPPPLPPKPKILPIKPSNWGQNAAPISPSKIPVDISRRNLGSASSSSAMVDQTGRNVYLDQPSSSFV